MYGLHPWIVIHFPYIHKTSEMYGNSSMATGTFHHKIHLPGKGLVVYKSRKILAHILGGLWPGRWAFLCITISQACWIFPKHLDPQPSRIPEQCSSLESAALGGTNIYCASPMLNATLNCPTSPPMTQYGWNEATWAKYFFKVDELGASWAVRHISHRQHRQHQYTLPICIVKFFPKSVGGYDEGLYDTWANEMKR